MAWARKFSDDQEVEICNDYISGMSLLQIANKWNCSDSGLQKLLRRNGVEMRKQGADISRRAISPEQEADVIKLYVDERVSAEKIAQLYGCSSIAIRGVLKRNSINMPIPQPRNINVAQRIIKPYQEKEVIDLYLGGMSTNKIADLYNCSSPPIIDALHRNGIELNQKFPRRKYPLWEDMFEKIDTEEKAYWLGFIYADGCVNKEKTTLSIGLSAIDVAHLEKFMDAISPGRPVYRSTRVAEWNGKKKLSHKATVSIWSTHLCDSLHNLGISKERQEPEKLFDAIPDSLFHHLLRGYFDGDGNASKNIYRIAFVGEYKLLRWIETMLNGFLNIGIDRAIYYPKNKRRVVGSIYFSGGNIARLVGEFMYHESTVYLERKKDIIDAW